MGYQKIISLLINENIQPSKFRTKNWVEIKNDARETYNTDSQIKYKTTMLKSSLCDYIDVYILFKGTITVTEIAAQDADANITNKKATSCAPFTDGICEIKKHKSQ